LNDKSKIATARAALTDAISVLPSPKATVYYLRMNADRRHCARRLPDDEVDLVVEVFRMMADATRIQVLWALASREMSDNDLAAHIGKPAPSVSQHLAKLRMARLVRTRREGTTIFYSLDNDHVGQLVTDAVFNAEHAGPGVPGHHRETADLAALHPTATATSSIRARSEGHRT
jgi:ArsR family transcriptional regulator